MWKVFKFFGWIIKAMLWVVLILFLGVIVGLYFAERGLPDALVQKVAARLSSYAHFEKAGEEPSPYDSFVFRIDRISYSLRRGLTVHRIKAFPKRVTERAFISAEEINVDFALFSLAPIKDRLKRVTLKGLDFPALPPRPPRDPDAPKPPSRIREVNVTLTDISPFELVLENANVLGLQTERVTATVAATPSHASATGVSVKWPERLGDLGATGNVMFDCETKRIVADAQGRTFPHLITPLLLGLRAKAVVQQIDCFQNFKTPVTADYAVDVELTTLDYTMLIGIDAQNFTYRDVPAKSVKGQITVTDTNNIVVADIGLAAGELKHGALSGRLVFRDDDDSLFIDAQGEMPKPDLISVINILNHGELDLIQCEGNVSVRATGVVATNPKKTSVTNDLSAAVLFAKGSALRVPLADVSCDLKVYAHSAQVDNIKGSPADGGKVEGWIHFAFPDYAASNTTFVAQFSASEADFSNLMCIAQATNAVTGKATGKVSLAGAAAGNVLGSLEGDGTLKVEDSVFARIPLFAGLTDWLANNIPGISSVVNQSAVKLDFTMTNGVAVTENLLVEGNIFSIRCKGSYALAADTVDMVARVNILREQTIVGWLLRRLTEPLTSVLLEFRVSGTASHPEWSYITFIEKLGDVFF